MAVKKVSAAEFDETIREGIWMADFYTDHCPPCKFLDIVIDQVLYDYPMVNLAKCNIDDDPEFIQRFEIMGTPTVILFNDGVQKDTFGGAQGRDRVEEALAKCMYD